VEITPSGICFQEKSFPQYFRCLIPSSNLMPKAEDRNNFFQHPPLLQAHKNKLLQQTTETYFRGIHNFKNLYQGLSRVTCPAKWAEISFTIQFTKKKQQSLA